MPLEANQRGTWPLVGLSPSHRLFGSDLYSARKVFSKFLSPDGHAGRQVSEIPVFQTLRYAGRLLIDSITSCLATTLDLVRSN
jgi:hypothetical protein